MGVRGGLGNGLCGWWVTMSTRLGSAETVLSKRPRGLNAREWSGVSMPTAPASARASKSTCQGRRDASVAMTPYRGRLAGRVAIKCTIPSEVDHSVHRQLGTVGCANVVAATGDAFASAGTTEEREGSSLRARETPCRESARMCGGGEGTTALTRGGVATSFFGTREPKSHPHAVRKRLKRKQPWRLSSSERTH